jgi:heme-degrading monooxygenase HmoA
MMTVITHVTIRQGAEPQWDAAMRERLSAARNHPGWITGQLLIPLDRPNARVIVGTWENRADWEAWHNDSAFLETRKRLDGLETAPSQEQWHEVIIRDK